MPTGSRRSWHVDWAGPHGTAWGTVNACLSTITCAWLIHLTERYWPATPNAGVSLAAGATALGLTATLLRAAFGRQRPGATTVYKLACWLGAGIWMMTAVHAPSWPARWLLAHIAGLAVLAVIAGVAAGLAADNGTDDQPPAPATAGTPVTPGLSRDEQQTLDTLAGQWRALLDRRCDGPGWEVPAIEQWPRGNGYTVQAVAPTGGSWRLAWRAQDTLGDDLELVYGGKIDVQQGRTRRIAIIDVTTVDLLAADTTYPTDRPVHSIRDDLRVGLRDDGGDIGPNLWQNCMLLAGEAGSGKTNASHCLTAEIVTTDDALQWDWELTGGGLWFAWMTDWLDGVYDTPPIDWCGFDGRELLWMTRAALRIGYARKPGYKHLMLAHDDDKLPVGPSLPAIIIMGDEIAQVCGSLSDHDEAKENLRLIAFELRAAAVRAVFLALRGTDDVISSGLQSQCQVRGVMKVNTTAEAMWALGVSGFGPEDTPYPGCGGLVRGSGMAPERLKYHRMLPSGIRVVARAAANRRPRLDDLSRLAANGRHPDGTPMAGLHEGELDCYDTRWDRFRAWAGRTSGTPARPAATGSSTTAGAGTGAPVATLTDAGVGATPEQAVANLAAAMDDLDRAAAAARARRVDHDDTDLDDDERAEFARLMTEEGFGDDWSSDEVRESPPQPTDLQTMLDAIRAEGPRGIKPRDLLIALAGHGIVISRSTLHKRLKDAESADQAHQPSHGRWAYGPDPRS